MFAPKMRPNTSNKRDKPYSRKAKTMPRSNSLLGTIKSIVSTPLSWFVSNQEGFEDLGKRRRVSTQDVSDVKDEQEERLGKRMRVDSPEPPPKRILPSTTSGYLDPPSFISHATQPSARLRQGRNAQPRRSSVLGGPFGLKNRTTSVDPPSRYAALSRDPAMIPLPGSPLRSSPARSVGPEDGAERPRTSFRLRTSLTPQPSPAKPVRREASAPPPLSSLRSRPVFVHPPPEEKKESSQGVQKTLSLGMLAEMSRDSRAPSRDRTLSSLGRTSSISDHIASSISSDAILQPSKSLSQKTFQELELYKTPILPSRYKDAGVIPTFLKPKRSHVLIPMKKDGGSKPSLGLAEKSMAEKGGLSTRDDGKPYARKGGVGKLLAKRKAEEQEQEQEQRQNAESTLTSVEEEDEMETDVEPVSNKRDVGVSARMTSGSEDERAKARNIVGSTEVVGISAATSTASRDPFTRPSAATPGGRQQPYGRVGRTRTREPGQRSVPLSRPANKFSAAFEEGDSVDSIDQTMSLDDATSTNTPQVDTEKSKTSAFDAPKGFSFADDTLTIKHDITKAKEPPIPMLPFSFGTKLAAHASDATDRTRETPSLKPPASTPSTVQPSSAQAEKKDGETLGAAPALSVVPPTPSQPAKDVKETSAPKNLFAAPSSTSGAGSSVTSSSASKPPEIPNFFANSPLLTGDKVTTPVPPKVSLPKPLVPPSGTTPATPVKDPENPLWNGNNTAPSAPPKLFAQAFTFGAGAKSTGETTSSAPGPALLPSPLFGTQPTSSGLAEQQQKNALPTASTSGTTVVEVSTPSAVGGPQSLPASDKPSEPEKTGNEHAPAPAFSFGSGTTSNVPKQLFGTGAPSTTSSPLSTQVTQSPQNATGEAAPKPVFSFGQPQPQASDTATKSTTTEPSINGPTTTERKSPFAFGTPSAASTAASSSASTASNAVAAPVPAPAPAQPFNAHSGGTGFTFGAPTAVPNNETSKPPASPFSFGAPPATPPAGERQASPFTFGTPAQPSGVSTGFGFGTPVKQNGAPAGSAPSTPTNTSPFTFGGQPSTQSARPVTPPPKPDDGMSMEESPVQMDTNNGQKKNAGSITFGFGPTPVNPFGQNTNSGSAFAFGAPSTANPFAPKDDNKPAVSDSTGGFNFNRTSSAPALSTSFSFGAKSDVSTPPATAFGAGPSNPFGQAQTSNTSSSPFTFGQQPSVPPANPFGAPTQSTQPPTAPTSSNPFSGTPTFTFGAPSGAPNPFAFGSSTPSSPATGATGLPQTSGTGGSVPAFTFGQSAGASGGSLFNIGAPPSNTGQGTPGRQIKRLPRRGQMAKR